MTSGNSQTLPGPQCPCLHRHGLNSADKGPREPPGRVVGAEARGPGPGCDGAAAPRGSPAWSPAGMAGAEEPRRRLPGSGAQESRRVQGVGTRGRRQGAANGTEGGDAHALPEMGSEVLGTERGTRPDTGPLSTANSISGKCAPGGGPGPGRGRAAEAGIFGSAWPPGGAHPTVSARGRRAAGLGPTRLSSARFGLPPADRTHPRPAPSGRGQWQGCFSPPANQG